MCTREEQISKAIHQTLDCLFSGVDPAKVARKLEQEATRLAIQDPRSDTEKWVDKMNIKYSKEAK